MTAAVGATALPPEHDTRTRLARQQDPQRDRLEGRLAGDAAADADGGRALSRADADAAGLGPRGHGARVRRLRRRLHRQRARDGADPAPRHLGGRPFDRLLLQRGRRRPARARRRRLLRAARLLLRGAGGQMALRGSVDRFPRQLPGTTQLALLVREMQFKRLELRQIAATLVGAATGSVSRSAASARGRSSGSCSERPSTSTVLLWLITPWRPQLRFSTASLKRLGRIRRQRLRRERALSGGPP